MLEAHLASWRSRTQRHPAESNSMRVSPIKNVMPEGGGGVRKIKVSYLEFSSHGHHIMIRGVVLVAVGEHQSDICRELLRVVIFSAVHLQLQQEKRS